MRQTGAPDRASIITTVPPARNRGAGRWCVGMLPASALLGMPVGAGYSATSANEAAGASSRWAGAFALLAMLVVVVTLLPSIALTPQPVLAAIVIHAVSRSLQPAIFRQYFAWRRDRLVALAVDAVLGVGPLTAAASAGAVVGAVGALDASLRAVLDAGRVVASISAAR